MNELIALALPPGDDFVSELVRAWDNGDAVLPLDPASPAAVRDRILSTMAPSKVIEAGAVHLRQGIPTEPGDAIVVTTSGTTGHPKGAVLTHDAIAASAVATSNRLGVVPGSDHWLVCLPVHHVGGLSVVTRALATNTALTVLPRFDVDAVTQAAKGGATLVSMVTTMLERMDTSGFRKILLGGSAIPIDRPSNTVATYGMTESGSGVIYDHLALDGVQVRVVNGEIQLRAPMLLRSYRDGTNPFTADGWFATGDGGSWDGGRLEVFGRRGDMIITGGENVWPAAVEKVLAADPAIAEVAVVGRPDAEWGQVVTAIIVPSGCGLVTLDQLRDAVKSVLPAAWAPRAIEVTDALPRTSIGKIVRSKL